jgi:hypothetical protein
LEDCHSLILISNFAKQQSKKATKQQSSKAAKQQSRSVIANLEMDDQVWKISHL